MIACLGAVQIGDRGLKSCFGNKALIDQRVVVVKLSLSHFNLGTRSFCLLFILTLSGQVFGVVDPGHNLSHFHSITFAYFQHHEFTGYAGFDHGAANGFERA